MSVDILNPDLCRYGTPRQGEYLAAALKHGSATKAAKALGVHPRTVQRAISSLKRNAVTAGAIELLPEEPSILYLDIETSPILAYIWGMFQEVRDISMLEQDWYILCWSAKWANDDEIITRSQRMYRGYSPGSEDDKKLMQELGTLLDQADYVVTHNGDRFDLKKINARMLLNNMRPVSPYRSIDTLKIAKRAFGFTSNRLAWLAETLFGEGKTPHEGFPLWRKVLQGDPSAWDVMEEYNAQDVRLLEKVYLKMAPWDHMHPNVNLATRQLDHACTVCGSTNIRPTGKIVTAGRAGTYAGYECVDCGHQMRGGTNFRSTAQLQAAMVNAR